MKKDRFLWSAHRITERQKAGKARSIKGKQLKNSRNTASRPHVARRSSASDNFRLPAFRAKAAIHATQPVPQCLPGNAARVFLFSGFDHGPENAHGPFYPGKELYADRTTRSGQNPRPCVGTAGRWGGRCRPRQFVPQSRYAHSAACRSSVRPDAAGAQLRSARTRRPQSRACAVQDTSLRTRA